MRTDTHTHTHPLPPSQHMPPPGQSRPVSRAARAGVGPQPGEPLGLSAWASFGPCWAGSSESSPWARGPALPPPTWHPAQDSAGCPSAPVGAGGSPKCHQEGAGPPHQSPIRGLTATARPPPVWPPGCPSAAPAQGTLYGAPGGRPCGEGSAPWVAPRGWRQDLSLCLREGPAAERTPTSAGPAGGSCRCRRPAAACLWLGRPWRRRQRPGSLGDDIGAVWPGVWGRPGRSVAGALGLAAAVPGLRTRALRGVPLPAGAELEAGERRGSCGPPSGFACCFLLLTPELSTPTGVEGRCDGPVPGPCLPPPLTHTARSPGASHRRSPVSATRRRAPGHGASPSQRSPATPPGNCWHATVLVPPTRTRAHTHTQSRTHTHARAHRLARAHTCPRAHG